jgi:hypothetical protein
MKLKKALFLGFSGEGATVKEATDNAKDRATAFCQDTRGTNPVLIRVGIWEAIIWRSQACWTYTIINGAHMQRSGQIPHIFWQSEKADLPETALAVIRHLCGLAWDHDVSDDASFCRAAFVENRLGSMTEAAIEKKIAESIRQAAWQRAYHRLKAAGYTEHDAHQHASSVVDGYLVLPPAQTLQLAA